VNIPQNMDKIDLKKKKTTASSPRKELGVYINNTWGTFLQMWTQKIELVRSPNIIENVDQMKTYLKKKLVACALGHIVNPNFLIL